MKLSGKTTRENKPNPNISDTAQLNLFEMFHLNMIFSSAEYFRRVLLLISRTVFSAVPFGVIIHPFYHR